MAKFVSTFAGCELVVMKLTGKYVLQELQATAESNSSWSGFQSF